MAEDFFETTLILDVVTGNCVRTALGFFEDDFVGSFYAHA
jgi:hypothetical protein